MFMKMKNILIVLLGLLAVVMIFLGVRADILPPVLTGIGFIIIAVLFYSGGYDNQKKKK